MEKIKKLHLKKITFNSIDECRKFRELYYEKGGIKEGSTKRFETTTTLYFVTNIMFADNNGLKDVSFTPIPLLAALEILNEKKSVNTVFTLIGKKVRFKSVEDCKKFQAKYFTLGGYWGKGNRNKLVFKNCIILYFHKEGMYQSMNIDWFNTYTNIEITPEEAFAIIGITETTDTKSIFTCFSPINIPTIDSNWLNSFKKKIIQDNIILKKSFKISKQQKNINL